MAAVAQRRMPGSTKIAIGFVLLGAAGYFGMKAVSGFLIDGEKFAPLEPSDVNIVGVNPGAGYYIVVANQVAQLIQGEVGEFDAPDVGNRESTEKKRIPLREMLNALRGDSKALSEFVRIMNAVPEFDIPDDMIWDAADIQKALDGDTRLATELAKDLSVDLEGNPMPETRATSLENGIGIRLQVPVEVASAAGPKTLYGAVVVQYRPVFAAAVWDKLKEKFDLPKEVVAGYYLEEANRLKANPEARENVRLSLQSQVTKGRSEALALAPQAIVKNAMIVVTDKHVRKASYVEKAKVEGKRSFAMTLELDDEGRRRLWQFSKRRIGDQILLVMDGIAVAAPKIEHELTQGEVEINQLPDEGIVQEVVEKLNAHGGDK